MHFVDNADVLQNVKFVAANYSRLPKYDPEELNICSVVDCQASAENKVASLSTKVESLASSCDPGANVSKVIETMEPNTDPGVRSDKPGSRWTEGRLLYLLKTGIQ